MFRKKLITTMLAAAMFMSTVSMNPVPVAADTDLSAVSSESTVSSSEEPVSSSSEGESGYSADSSSSDSSDPSGSSSSSGTSADSGVQPDQSTSGDSGSSSSESAQDAESADSTDETADEDKTEDSKEDSEEDETDADASAIPDFSGVSVTSTAVISSGKQITISKALRSDDVRMDYTKVDKVKAISEQDGLEFKESADENARTVGTIDRDGILYILKRSGKWVYAESGNVRGYVKTAALMTGTDATAYLTGKTESDLPVANVVVALKENAAADDTTTTVYQFHTINGTILTEYARSHASSVYKCAGGSWNTGVDNQSFIDKVLKFYGLNDTSIAEDSAPDGAGSAVNSPYVNYGTAVASLDLSKAGDILILTDGKLALNTGDGNVLMCSKEDGGVTEKALSEVTVSAIRRPDYSQNAITTLPYYNQKSASLTPEGAESWVGDALCTASENSTIATDGSGETALAMALTGITGKNIYPSELAKTVQEKGEDYCTKHSHGAINRFLVSYNLKAATEMSGPSSSCCGTAAYDETTLKNSVATRHPVLVYVKGGTYDASGSGHYILLFGQGANGPIVYDPAQALKTMDSMNNGGSDWNSVLANAQHIWILSKVKAITPSFKYSNYEEDPAETVYLNDDGLEGDSVEEQCFNYFVSVMGLSPAAACGALGNIACESGFKTNNLENWVNSVLGVDDDLFTAAVDSGVYTEDQFLNDRYTYVNGHASQWGYGLIGFTSAGIKSVLWDNTVAKGRSLSDLRGQLDAVAQFYSAQISWISGASASQAAADWFYYVEMGNSQGGTNDYGYGSTIPLRQAYANAFYAEFVG